MREKLRIGILTDSLSIPNWAYKMFEESFDSSCFKIILVVQNVSSIKTGSTQKRVRIQSIFWKFYYKLDNIIYKKPSNAILKRELKKIVNCDILKISPTQTKYREEINSQDIEKIKRYRIDVFINLGFQLIKGKILLCSKYGIWSLCSNKSPYQNESIEGTWEVLNNEDNTCVILKVLKNQFDEELVIGHSIWRTDLISISRNRNNYYWKGMLLVIRKLKMLHENGEDHFFRDIKMKNQHPHFFSNQLYCEPKNWELLSKISSNYFTRIKKKISDFFYFDQWILLININKNERLSKSIIDFKKIKPPKDRFWADPFGIKKNNKFYIFIEEVIFKKGKGHISVIEMDMNGNFSNPEIVLEKDYHLSYPFLIEDKGSLYMIPESNENKQIELYKCIEFPKKWKLVNILMHNVSAVDTTVFKRNEKYWLFTNIRVTKGTSNSDELFLFYSDKLNTSNWESHSKNPIISDVNKSRPAGNLFLLNGELYRPSQDCSKRYGYGINFSHISILDEFNYKETIVDNIYPNWDDEIICTHTFNSTKELTIIDAVLRRRK